MYPFKTIPLCGTEWSIPQFLQTSVQFQMKNQTFELSVAGAQLVCKKLGRSSLLRKFIAHVQGFQLFGCGILLTPISDSITIASGGLALSNAIAGYYGEEVCKVALTWIFRGVIKVSPGCTAQCFLPNSSIRDTGYVVNQRLPTYICNGMKFAKTVENDLYWIPGDGLPWFKVWKEEGMPFCLVEEVQYIFTSAHRVSAKIDAGFGSC